MGYPPECDHVRMCNLGQEFGGRQVLFLRFNPDPYRPLPGSGPVVPLTQRTQDLVQLLRTFMSGELPRSDTAFTAVVRLFFDGHDQRAIGAVLDPRSWTTLVTIER